MVTQVHDGDRSSRLAIARIAGLLALVASDPNKEHDVVPCRPQGILTQVSVRPRAA
jgi:hypothetical protein